MATEDIGAKPLPCRASSASAVIAATQAVAEPRQMFSVELKPGETTIVSWKKLTRDADKVDALSSASAAAPPSGAHPVLESRIAPAIAANDPTEVESNDAPQSMSRFISVSERIERLYMNDDLEVDKSATKQNGFFVNRGKLEKVEPSLTSDTEPKKRRRKEAVKSLSDKNGGHSSSTCVHIQDEERLKRRKLSSAPKTEQTLRLSSQVRDGQERSAIDSAGRVLVSSQKDVFNLVFHSSGRSLT